MIGRDANRHRPKEKIEREKICRIRKDWIRQVIGKKVEEEKEVVMMSRDKKRRRKLYKAIQEKEKKRKR